MRPVVVSRDYSSCRPRSHDSTAVRYSSLSDFLRTGGVNQVRSWGAITTCTHTAFGTLQEVLTLVVLCGSTHEVLGEPRRGVDAAGLLPPAEEGWHDEVLVSSFSRLASHLGRGGSVLSLCNDALTVHCSVLDYR